MTPIVVIIFILGSLGAAAIAAATLGSGIHGFKTERLQTHDKDEDMDGFSALFAGGMMATAGIFTLVCMALVIAFCAWRFFSVMF